MGWLIGIGIAQLVVLLYIAFCASLGMTAQRLDAHLDLIVRTIREPGG